MTALPGQNDATAGKNAAVRGQNAATIATIFTSVLLAGAGQPPVGNLSLDEAYRLYREARGAVEWMEDPQARRRFFGILEYALRAQAPAASFVIRQVIRQALGNGLAYVYAKTSPEARQVYQWARAVSREASRLKGLIRLTPSWKEGQPALTGAVPMRYDLADIMLAHFSRRFPGYRIILDTDRGVFEGNHDLKEDYFTTLWGAYYDSQIIQGRLDINRARKALPKRYWRWVREGQKLRSYERMLKKKR